MASRGDEVEQSMNTIVPESWVALDPRFFSENVVVLALQIPDNLRKAAQISALITPEFIL